MKTRYSEVEKFITEGISSGKWKPGEVLPKEVELCEMLGVSRTTVRTAMANLVQAGQVIRIKRKGTLVRQWQQKEASTLFIESLFSDEHKEALVTEVLELRCVAAPEHVQKLLELPEGASAVRLLRLCYLKNNFDNGPISLISSWLPEKLWSSVERCDFECETLEQVLERVGVRGTQMEKLITVHNLTEREARLIGEKNGSAALCVSTLIRAEGKMIVEYSESIYPADRNELILRIQR